MRDAQLRKPFKACKSSLNPERFAFVSDGTYSPSQVEATTAEVEQHIPDDLRLAPTAKMFLRTFWYRLLRAELAAADQMHLYTVARWASKPLSQPVVSQACAAGRCEVCV